MFHQLIKPYIAYVAMFVGTGIISGSVVHAGDERVLVRSLILLAFGMILFIVGSYVREVQYGTGEIEKGHLFKFIGLSFLLALGIGMISGSIQHYLDTPKYASMLMPTGVIVALVAYVWRMEHKLTTQQWVKLLIGVSLTGAVLFGLLYKAIDFIPQSWFGSAHQHGQTESSEPMPNLHGTHSDTPDAHAAQITDEKSYLMHMIPHHQEAVDTSQWLLKSTTNSDFRPFLQKVIEVQNQEITQMKRWLQDWYGMSDIHDGAYHPMMSVNSQTTYVPHQSEAEYLKGMIDHHKQAVNVSQQLRTFTQRPELLKMADEIQRTQMDEIKQMNTWLKQLESAYPELTPSNKHPVAKPTENKGTHNHSTHQHP